jgi:hypothetical protein
MSRHELLELLAEIQDREQKEAKLVEELRKLAGERGQLIAKLAAALDIMKQ